MVTTLWNIFLIMVLIFLIILVFILTVGTVYNYLIGNKKEEEKRAKAKEELLNSLQELAKELDNCMCEKDNKDNQTKKKTTKKTTKKESE